MRRRCPAGVELSAWLDGELSASRRRRIENHVESCPFCAEQIATLGRVRRVVGGLDQLAPVEMKTTPSRMWRRLRVALTEDRVRVRWRSRLTHSGSSSPRPSVWWGAGSLAGALAIFLFVLSARGLPEWPSSGPRVQPGNGAATAGGAGEGGWLGNGQSAAIGSADAPGRGEGRWGATPGAAPAGARVADGLTGVVGIRSSPSDPAASQQSAMPAMGSLDLKAWTVGWAGPSRSGPAGVDYPRLEAAGGMGEGSVQDRLDGNVTTASSRSGSGRKTTAAGDPKRNQTDTEKAEPSSSAPTLPDSREAVTVVPASWHPTTSDGGASDSPTTATGQGSGGASTAVAVPTAAAAISDPLGQRASTASKPGGREAERGAKSAVSVASAGGAEPAAWQPLKEDHEAYAQQQGALSADQVGAAVVEMAVMAAASVPAGGDGAAAGK